MTSVAKSRWALLGFLVLTFAASGLGSYATQTSVGTWYQTLARPTFSPPDWVFAPVWTTLYLMIAVAGWWVWRSPASLARTRALGLWYLQLALNVIWSFLFFGARDISAATVEIGLLLACLMACLFTFARIDRWAFWLFIPYTGWVAFATVLTVSLHVLNPGA